MQFLRVTVAGNPHLVNTSEIALVGVSEWPEERGEPDPETGERPVEIVRGVVVTLKSGFQFPVDQDMDAFNNTFA